jgi:hypothetical protein
MCAKAIFVSHDTADIYFPKTEGTWMKNPFIDYSSFYYVSETFDDDEFIQPDVNLDVSQDEVSMEKTVIGEIGNFVDAITSHTLVSRWDGGDEELRTSCNGLPGLLDFMLRRAKFSCGMDLASPNDATPPPPPPNFEEECYVFGDNDECSTNYLDRDKELDLDRFIVTYIEDIEIDHKLGTLIFMHENPNMTRGANKFLTIRGKYIHSVSMKHFLWLLVRPTIQRFYRTVGDSARGERKDKNVLLFENLKKLYTKEISQKQQKIEKFTKTYNSFIKNGGLHLFVSTYMTDLLLPCDYHQALSMMFYTFYEREIHIPRFIHVLIPTYSEIKLIDFLDVMSHYTRIRNPIFFTCGRHLKVFILRHPIEIFGESDFDIIYAQAPNMFGLDATKINGTVDDLSALVSKLSESLDQTKDAVSFVTHSVVPKTVLILFLTSTVYGIFRWYKFGDYSLIVQSSTILALGAIVFPDYLVKELMSLLPTKDAPVAQSPFSWDIVVKMSTVVLSFLAGMDFNKCTYKMKDLLSGIGNLPKLETGINHLMSSFFQIAESVINWIRTEILRMHPIMSDTSSIEEVKNFIDESIIVITRSYEIKPPYNIEDFNRIIRLQQAGAQLYSRSNLGDRTQTDNAKKVIAKYIGLLANARKPYDATSLRSEFTRCEPLVILLRGKPGQGKSLAGSLLAQLLTAELQNIDPTIVRDKTTDHIYSRAPETAYWEGYGGQFCTFMDDFGQAKDVAGNPDNEYVSLIRLGNSFQSPLHMASLEAKANTFFESPLVICTTNQTNFQNVNSIHFKEALTRRFDVVADFRVNDAKHENGEYMYAVEKNGILMLDANRWCEDAVIVDLYRNMTPTSEGELTKTMTFMEFKKHCIVRFDQKRTAYAHILRANDFIFDSVSESMRPESTFDYDAPEDSFLDMVDVDSIDDEEVLATQEAIKNRTGDDIPLIDIAAFISYLLVVKTQWSDTIGHIIATAASKTHILFADIYEQMKRKCKSSIDFNKLRLTLADQKRHIQAFVSASKDWAPKWAQSVHKYLEELFGKYPIIKITGAIVSLFAIIKLMLWFLFPEKEAESAPLKAIKAGGTVFTPRSSNRTYIKTDGGDITANAPKDDKDAKKGQDVVLAEAPPDMEDYHVIASKVINKNTLLVKKGGSDEVWSRATIICGSIAIMPTHYFTLAKQAILCETDAPGLSIDFFTIKDDLVKESTIQEFLDMERVDIPDTDVSLFVLPGRLKTFPNIVKHFVSIKDIDVKYIPSYVIMTREKFKKDIHHVECISVQKSMTYKLINGTKVQTNHYLEYQIESNFGDCGSFIFARDLNFYPAPILGMHIAGSKGLLGSRGFSTVLSREMLEKYISKISPIERCSPPVESDKYFVPTAINYFHSKFRLGGNTSLNVGSGAQTHLRPIYEFKDKFGPCTIAPAKMSPVEVNGELYDPFANRILAYTKPSPFIQEDVLIEVANHTYETMKTRSSQLKHINITFRQAIEGIEGVPYIDSISRKTSAGYPKSKEKPPSSKGKKYYFGDMADFELDTPQALEVEKEVNDILEAASRGERKIHIYSDFLKDETRPKEKVLKPRIVSGCPMAYFIAVRMKFLPIISWMMMNRIDNGFAVGTNPYKEWTDLAMYLKNDSEDCLIAGDFSGFDTSINSSFYIGVNHFFQRCLLDSGCTGDYEKESMCMSVLLLDIFNSVHVRGNKIYFWNSGMPSGNPLTTIVNCLVNQFVIRFAWIHTHGMRSASLRSFNTNVKAIVYGDDNIISVSEEAKSKFNPLSIVGAMANLNFIYTSENKGELIEKFRTIYDVTFLKRHFVWSDERKIMLPPLEFETVRQMMYFAQKNKDFKSVVISCYESFLHELALYPDKWDEYYNIAAPVMSEHFGYKTTITDKGERMSKTLSLEMIY